MNVFLTDQILQILAWFIVLFSSIVGLYCLVINFGRSLNWFVFLYAVSAAIRYLSLGMLIKTVDPSQAAIMHATMVMMANVQEPLLVVITLILLRSHLPGGWWHRLPYIIILLGLLVPAITLIDLLFGTGLYYDGLKATYTGGYVSTAQIEHGPLFGWLTVLDLLLVRLPVFAFVLYVALLDQRSTQLTRTIAGFILASFGAFVAISLVPPTLMRELVTEVIIGAISPLGYLVAIFLHIFSRNPFRRGSLQTRLLAVILSTAVPIMIAVALLSQRSERASWGSLILGTAMLLVLTWLTIRYSIQPIEALTETAAAIARGDLSRTAPVSSADEIGALAGSFNSMTEQIRTLINELEQRVSDRTRELERRAVQLETSSRVGQHITSILDRDRLLGQVVELIQAGFNYYFVGIWLLRRREEKLILRAGAGRLGGVPTTEPIVLPPNQPGVVGQVYRSGEMQIVNNANHVTDYVRLEGLPDTRSEMALPLRMQDRTIGVLDIHSDEFGAFSRDDGVVFQLLADEIAVAIRNAHLYEAEQERRRFAEALSKTARLLSSSLNVQELNGLIMEQLARAVPYERCSVLLEQEGVLRFVAQRGFPDDRRLLGVRVSIRPGDIYDRVVNTGQPVRLDDVTDDPLWQQLDWLPLNLSWLGVPLIARDRVIGMISLTRREEAAFTDDDARLVSAFVGHAAIALENANLYDRITQLNEGLERKVAQRTAELNRAYHTLERLDKTKSDFINVLAHELRTPLTIIRGYTQVLLRSQPAYSASGEVSEMLEGILHGVDRLRDIVDSMLDITKIENEVLLMHPEAVSVFDVVESVQRKFSQAVKERGLVLTYDALLHLPDVEADPDLLEKVFYHLIMNAIKYVPDGGSINITGETHLEAQNGALLEVVVSDSGIGINPRDHDLIFEKFYQTGEVSVHSSGRTKFKGGGPGLGLAIARGIIEAHGGKIWVESNGHDEDACPGSRFYLQLPLDGADN